MHRTTIDLTNGSRPGADSGSWERAAGGDVGGLADHLSAEFSAPVGVTGPRGGVWLAWSGVPAAFPAVAAEAVQAACARGQAAVWRDPASSPSPAGPVWLLVPLRLPRGPLIAAAGFAADGSAAAGSPWGPPCPDRALLAWGHSVADRLRAVAAGAAAGPTPAAGPPATAGAATAVARAAGDGNERQVVARLIRRLRISDPPERFQQLATNALRSVLAVRAVAWVPCHHADPVVHNGEVGRLKGNDYRLFLPGAHSREAHWVDNDPATPPDPGVRRVVAASADSQGALGWLIALNPLDGRAFTTADAELIQPVASLIGTQQVNARVYADLKELLFGVIHALTSAIDAKDPYTSGHSERVARIAVRLGEELGMNANQRGDLYLAGLLHDVGKIGVDDAVLKKPGPLSPEEYRQIQAHVEIGVHILHDLKKLSHLLPGVRHHHESMDGKGYPCGLVGEAIPFEARVLAVADSFDAMSSTRPYRRRLTPSQIDDILRKGSGVQWDSKIIAALFACRMDLEAIRQKGLGESLQMAVSDTLGRG